MSKVENIPAPAVRRLSFYLRQLEIFDAADHRTVSSRQLGEALSISDAQVRKDFAYFGQFGHPGIGYRVAELIPRVRRILGTDKKSNVLLVGVGNLGRALISFRGFSKRGFEVVAVFDKDPEKVGAIVAGPISLRIQPLSEMPGTVRRHAIRVGILAVPATAAQSVAEEMIAAGIRGILNFAPVTLQVGPEVGVASVDLAVHLEQLSFQLTALSAAAT
jgi:redox-sensing transcriptional repressor